eukprot:maker-scaffold351_size199180-snap-gene-0.27 protein:Tk02211 transcript:maker-scaffold351_size199180-snap-gene-0.27-mRNA-1 annotation:"small glutamine-rich tetratricopeptide repeat-containing protein a"
MTEKRRLVFSLVQFLQREMASDEHSDDAKESLEVASQCLQTAFCLSPDDAHLEVNTQLEDLFRAATQGEPLKKKDSPPPEDKAKAERIKLEGNELMKKEDFEKAIELYTQAIELDPNNQVLYCNRAAAHSKMNNHYAAVEDCKRAIDMDPTYGKAYGRMGLAYSSVEKHKEAVECFTQAVNLEPDNESYKSNLQLATEKLATTGSPGPAQVNLPVGGFDMGGFLNNPAMMNMATSLLNDPNMQNMMSQLMSGGMVPEGNNMDGLLQAGQRIAEQMQQSNPDLVENLRRQMQGGPDGSSDQNPPPGTS